MIDLSRSARLDDSIGEASEAGVLLAECRKLDRSVKIFVGVTEDGARRTLTATGKRFAPVERTIPLDASPTIATTELLAELLKSLQLVTFNHARRMQRVVR